MDPQLLTRKQAMELMGVSAPTFRKVVREGNVPSLQYPLGKQRIFYRKQDIDKLLTPKDRQAA